MEIDDSIDKDVLDYLLKSLNLSEQDVLKINGPINLYRLMKLADLVDRDDLKFSPFEAFVPQATCYSRKIYSIKYQITITYYIILMILSAR